MDVVVDGMVSTVVVEAELGLEQAKNFLECFLRNAFFV